MGKSFAPPPVMPSFMNIPTTTQTPASIPSFPSNAESAGKSVSGTSHSETRELHKRTHHVHTDAPVSLTPSESDSLTSMAKDIRGLNLSFQRHLASILEKDCFADLSLVLGNEYASHWKRITEKYSNVAKFLKSGASSSIAVDSIGGMVKASKEPESKNAPSFGFTKPSATNGTVPPPAFSFQPKGDTEMKDLSSGSTLPTFAFGAGLPVPEKKKETTVVTAPEKEKEISMPIGSSDTKKEAALPSFPFGGASTTTISDTKKETTIPTLPFGGASAPLIESKKDTPISAFAFGASLTETKKKEDVSSVPAPAVPSFSFVPKTTIAPLEDTKKDFVAPSFRFSSSAPSSAPETPKKESSFVPPPVSAFSLGGSGTTTPSKPPAEAGAAAPAFKPFAFANPIGFNGIKKADLNDADTKEKESKAPAPSFSTPFKSAPAFGGFGTASTDGGSGSAMPSFSFGSAATPSVTQKPPAPGFSFGGGSSTPFASGTAGFGSGTTGFSFTASAPSSTPALTGTTGTEEDGEEGDHMPPEAQLGDALLTASVGEENETTLFSVRARVHKFVDGKWDSVGLGLLKVNQLKDSKKARLLLRTEAGQVLLNVSVFPEMNVSVVDKSLKFNAALDVGGKLTQLTARVKEGTDAVKLYEALEGVKKMG